MHDILKHFSYSHLPAKLSEISRPFHDMAHFLVNTLGDGDELRAALRKLLEAKDCAVRQRIDDGALPKPKTGEADES